MKIHEHYFSFQQERALPLSFLWCSTVELGELLKDELGKSVPVLLCPVLEDGHREVIGLLALADQDRPHQVCSRTVTLGVIKLSSMANSSEQLQYERTETMNRPLMVLHIVLWKHVSDD